MVGYTGGCSHPGSLCVRAVCRALPLAAAKRVTCRLWRTHTSSPSAGTASAALTLTLAQTRHTTIAGEQCWYRPLHALSDRDLNHCTSAVVPSHLYLWHVTSASASLQALTTHIAVPLVFCSSSPAAKARRVLSAARCTPGAGAFAPHLAHAIGPTTVAALHSLFPAMNEQVLLCLCSQMDADAPCESALGCMKV